MPKDLENADAMIVTADRDLAQEILLLVQLQSRNWAIGYCRTMTEALAVEPGRQVIYILDAAGMKLQPSQIEALRGPGKPPTVVLTNSETEPISLPAVQMIPRDAISVEVILTLIDLAVQHARDRFGKQERQSPAGR